MLSAGVARAVITPPVGIQLVGFAGRGGAEAIHDELTATALVLVASDSVGTQRLALVCCDLLSLDSDVVSRCRTAIHELTGIEESAILLACSHTHYGPATALDGLTLGGGPSPQVGPYVENLAHVLAGAVLAASTNMVDSTLSFGTGDVQIGVNRRERRPDGRIVLGQNPDGPVDPRVAVLRVDARDGRPLAAVVNYACHPVSFRKVCTHVSADYPGVVRRVVEETTGATCLFLQGAAGDINPLLMDWSWDHLDRSGLPLGAEAVRAYYAAAQVDEVGVGLTLEQETLALPPLLPSSEQEAIDELASLEGQIAAAQGDRGAAYWARKRTERLRAGLAVLRGQEPATTLDAEITAVRIGGSVGLITAPGEIFTEIGQRILRGSPFPHTLYAGYTNGSIGYVPTRAAYPEGGYEVDRGCNIAPEGGALLESASIKLLESVES